jgi:hypothetical protein
MPPQFNVTDEDISYAESVLLPSGKYFDDERRNFIRNLETIDLQAVPGSGKTTALLAKLLILERKLPFANGSGILVISHTNSAIEEISKRLQKHCPLLFAYPNFVGTIQGFVNEFLAGPYYKNRFKSSISRIDSDAFFEASEAFWWRTLPGFSSQEQKNARHFLKGKDLLHKYRFGFINNQFCILSSLNGEQIVIQKPRRSNQMSYTDFSDAEKEKIGKWMIDFKTSIWKKGILHYDDAFFMAETYVQKIPIIASLLQKRFSYVFVDEMQDMDKHQYELLEKLFYDNSRSASKFQRIGDKNQAIYDGEAKVDSYWEDRATVLTINGSCRLTLANASLVDKFALYRPSGFGVVGLREGSLKPHAIVYDSSSILNVIPRFFQLIDALKAEGKIPASLDDGIKIIGWNTIWKQDDNKNKPNAVRLIDFHPAFTREDHAPQIDYKSLKDYLEHFDRSKPTLAAIRKNILNALLKILRKENCFDGNGRYFTKRSLIEKISQNSIGIHAESSLQFQRNLYDWSIGIIRGQTNSVYASIIDYLSGFLAIFERTKANSGEFIDGGVSVVSEIPTNLVPNQISTESGIKATVSTVHASKGQTHSITLYLESSYYGEHETDRLHNQFLGNDFSHSKDRHKTSTKMVYVGLSRATTLLCIAIHKTRFEKHFAMLDQNNWEVIQA